MSYAEEILCIVVCGCWNNEKGDVKFVAPNLQVAMTLAAKLLGVEKVARVDHWGAQGSGGSRFVPTSRLGYANGNIRVPHEEWAKADFPRLHFECASMAVPSAEVSGRDKGKLKRKRLGAGLYEVGYPGEKPLAVISRRDSYDGHTWTVVMQDESHVQFEYNRTLSDAMDTLMRHLRHQETVAAFPQFIRTVDLHRL